MRGSALAFLVLLVGAPPWASHFRYERAISVPSAGRACAVLDPAIYVHAAGSLADLRLRSADAKQELPFVLTMSQATAGETATAEVKNLRQQGRAVAFDLAMPARPYTDVRLKLADGDFLLTAVVSGVASPAEPLGSFTLFNLSSEHLPLNTTLPLQESIYPALHVRLVPSVGSEPLTPAMVLGAEVPPSREAQTLYTAALSTRQIAQVGGETRVSFTVPPHMPIERVRVSLRSDVTKSFARQLRITSHVVGEPQEAGEQVSGTIERVQLRRDGLVIRSERLAVPATLGANLQHAAVVQVAILNGDEAPLPVAAVTLETREHELCFHAPTGLGALLFYGDSRAEVATYDPAQVLRPGAPALRATIGPEQLNARSKPRDDERPLLKRHPRLIYLGSILLICLGALIFLRTSRLRL